MILIFLRGQNSKCCNDEMHFKMFELALGLKVNFY